MTKPIQSGGEAMPIKATNPDQDFPIPYVKQEPEDDLRDAITLFEVMDVVLDHGCTYGMTRENVSNLTVLFSEAREKLSPILEYLDADRRAGTLEQYQAARRAVILRSCEGVAA